MAASSATGFGHLKRTISVRKEQTFIKEYAKIKEDPKQGVSLLMEYAQAGEFANNVKWDEQKFTDTETNKRMFKTICTIGGNTFPAGEVKSSKKEAKHAAAKKVLQLLLGSLSTDNATMFENQRQSRQSSTEGAPPDPANEHKEPIPKERVVEALNHTDNKPKTAEIIYVQPGSIGQIDGELPEQERTRLQTNHDKLMENLNIKYILPSLYSKKVLPASLYEELFSLCDTGRTQKATHEFLLYLPKQGIETYNIFCGILKENTPWLYDLLVPKEANAPLSVEEETMTKTVPESLQPPTYHSLVQNRAEPTPSLGHHAAWEPHNQERNIDRETVPKHVQETVPRGFEQTVPKYVQETTPKFVEETVPKYAQETVPKQLENLSGDGIRETLKNLKEDDIKRLKECLNNQDISSPISILKEFCEKHKLSLQYVEEQQNNCRCKINGEYMPGFTQEDKKLAKIGAARNALKHIKDMVEIKEISSPLRNCLVLIEEFHKEKKTPVKIVEEYAKAARLPNPSYAQQPNPDNDRTDGIFTFCCTIGEVELGIGTAKGKNNARHVAARQAFLKLLMFSRLENVSTDSPPSGPPDGANNIVPTQQHAAANHGNHFGASSDLLEYYNMKNYPRGLMLIISNTTFTKHNDRHGNEQDTQGLIKTFSQLGFKIDVQKDLSSQAICNEVVKFSSNQPANTDCMVLAILSHGENGKILGTDSESVGLEAIYERFGGEYCPQLLGKPKLFILQACRGERRDEGASLTTDSSGIPNLMRSESWWSHLQADNDSMKQRIPKMADIIVAYPTVPGFVSWRDEAKGSLFIRSLCDIFDSHAKDGHDIAYLLKMVNAKVANIKNGLVKGRHVTQIPEIVDRLTKLWKF